MRRAIATELCAKQRFVESALRSPAPSAWSGAAARPPAEAVYGAPAKRLASGSPVTVGYPRLATSGTAVAWAFVVR
jgi:hypothetical protein